MRRRWGRGFLSGLALVFVMVSVGLQMPPAWALYGIQEYALTNGSLGPNGLALGSDGHLWFTEWDASRIGTINYTTQGGGISYLEWDTPTASSGPSAIAAGPDGRLWFTEFDANQIGAMTTSGSITEYPIPSADGAPLGIAAGPDGRMWFTEAATNQIGRVTTGGKFTMFDTPSAGSYPVSIAAGSDGKMWFTEDGINRIGWISTDGSTKGDYPDTGGSGPWGIAPGADGRLWFTDLGSDDIRAITTGGTLSPAYPTPTANSDPSDISPGPDGHLWFSEFSGNNIAFSTTGGSITESPVPTAGSEPESPAPGSDGDMWFVEKLGDQIGQVDLQQPNLTNVYYIPNRFVMKVAPVAHQGDTVSWLMLNPGRHGIADASGMGLFGSRVTVIGGSYAYSFIGAGTYAYQDPFRPSAKGTVQVPIVVAPVVGIPNTAGVTWASADAPTGFGFDVQVRPPGSKSFVDWRIGQPGPSGAFGASDPLYVGPGRYAFRSRMRNLTNGSASGYSKPMSIKMS